MVRARVRRWLRPIARLFDRESIWRVPMLTGTVLGAVLAVPTLLFSLVAFLVGDDWAGGGLLWSAIVTFAAAFVVGAFAAMVIRIYASTMRRDR